MISDGIHCTHVTVLTSHDVSRGWGLHSNRTNSQSVLCDVRVVSMLMATLGRREIYRMKKMEIRGRGQGMGITSRLLPAQSLQLDVLVVPATKRDELIVRSGLADQAVLDEVSRSELISLRGVRE